MRRIRARSLLTVLVIMLVFGIALVLWLSGAQAVIAGRISLGDLRTSMLYVMLVASIGAVLAEVLGEVVARRRRHRAPARAAGGPLRHPDPGTAAFAACAPAAASRVHLRSRDLSLSFATLLPGADDLSLAIEAGETVAWSVRPAPARPRFSSCCCASTTSAEARSGLTVSTSDQLDLHDVRDAIGSCRRTR